MGRPGRNSGVGGTVTKNGAGTLLLSAANTYSGSTTVNGGTLHLAGGGLANSFIDVNAGSTFRQTAGTNNVTGTGGDLTVAGSGQYQLRGGTLNFGDYISTDSAWNPSDTSSINLTNGNQFEFTGGSLLNVSNIVVTGSTFTQDDTFGQSHFYVGQNGDLGPAVAAETTINGGYSLLGGVLDLDVFGDDLTPEQCCDNVPSDNDQLTVLGEVYLNSTVSLHFQNGYEPEFGDVFTLLCTTEGIDYGSGFSIDGGFFRIVDTGNDQFPTALQAIVPEPASIAVWTLVGLAGAAGAWRLRRKKSTN